MNLPTEVGLYWALYWERHHSRENRPNGPHNALLQITGEPPFSVAIVHPLSRTPSDFPTAFSVRPGDTGTGLLAVGPRIEPPACPPPGP